MILHRARPSGLLSNITGRQALAAAGIYETRPAPRVNYAAIRSCHFLTGSANASQLYISGVRRPAADRRGSGSQILFRNERPQNRRIVEGGGRGFGRIGRGFERQASRFGQGRQGRFGEFRFGAAGRRQYRLQPKYVDAGLYALSRPNHQRLSQCRRQGGEGSGSLHHRQSRSARGRIRR